MSKLAFLDSISGNQKASDSGTAIPRPSNLLESNSFIEAILEQYPNVTSVAEHKTGSAILQTIGGNSPYLQRLVRRQSECLLYMCEQSPEAAFKQSMQTLQSADCQTISQPQMVKLLRMAKQQIALITAIADITGHWGVMTVTRYLSEFADLAIQKATDFLLIKAAQQGELNLPDISSPQTGSHLLILGMGKLGAFELNYSSDIDLIILFDRDQAPYVGTRGIQQYFNKFAQELTALLQERTADGYVFRTDLRLRPDPRSTPLAVGLNSAISYYESLGQNWERAAMIKARQIAGDPVAGEYFNTHITPYIWRKHLDYAAVADIHSIKRQMNVKASDTITLSEHNIKVGRGGIREIEFYVQTQQLVWGGRYPELRTKPTLETLAELEKLELVTPENAKQLHDSYLFLRRVEHYLQMIHDHQTHSLPDSDDGFDHLAAFLGYDSRETLCDELLHHLSGVHRIYINSMEGTPPLAVDGNLVFTGVEADPETLKTLESMGYKHGLSVSDLIQSWHRGSRRATRTKRARELLTELIPTILTTLSNTANPDNAFMRFDDFLARLPAGIQIFSLLNNHPDILELLAHILGSAPALADILSKQPTLLDAVVHGDFFDPLPTHDHMQGEINDRLSYAYDYEDGLRILRTYKNEREFQAGVQMIKGVVEPDVISVFLCDLAEALSANLIAITKQEFAQKHGTIDNTDIAIIGMGKFGSKELTFGSDLDLIFIYSGEDIEAQSSGEKSVDLKTYYNRFFSRLLNAYTLLTKEGRLYEIDTRLRPSGADSSLATYLEAFDQYFKGMAWVFEFMALTRSRVIYSSSETLRISLETIITNHLSRKHNHNELVDEVRRMRDKIAEQYRTDNPWYIKHVRGGLVDLDFIAQFLLLKYAHGIPEMIQSNSARVFEVAQQHKILDDAIATQLIKAHGFLSNMLSFLRLTSPTEIIEKSTPRGLKNLLAERFGIQPFNKLEEKLIDTEAFVLEHYEKLDAL